ncbi:MAG TPA: LysM peptidoglycan-binding domain-containing protein [Candidatus Binatia bacterium]|nr:LysM peptidoglycan-binding domain-containing protein [Candidatus Binatia bacterium]
MITDVQAPLRAARGRPLRLGRLLLVGGVVLLLLRGLSAVSAGAVSPAGAATVTVRPGDTVWSIVERHFPGDDVRERVAEILQINGLHSAVIQPGETLALPRA